MMVHNHGFYFSLQVPAIASSAHTYADLLIGTEGATPGSAIAGGNSFPGASLPWAMAKPGIDASYIGVSDGTSVGYNAGFSQLGTVAAISMAHINGTRGVPTCKLPMEMIFF